MLRPRLIPTLLLRDNGLVKTTKFKDPIYIGDPLNTVRIFNQKEVDELILLDIDASRLGNQPNFSLISKIARECRMPFCYGGGVSQPSQVEKLVSLGVEKVAIGSYAFENDLISKSAEIVGAQSLVLLLNVKTSIFGKPFFFTPLANRISIPFYELLSMINSIGCGEVVFHFAEREGTGLGYDLSLIESILTKVTVPVTVIGGASSLQDVKSLYSHFPLIGAGAGSIFCFKGAYKAVLLQYPLAPDRVSLYS